VRDYELMYIVRPEVDDETLRAATESVATMVHGLGGEISKTAMWGKRRLAYSIGHLRDGHYVVCQLRLEPSRITELERALKIHDTVFRHLLVRKAEGAAAEEGERAEERGEEGVAAGADGELGGLPPEGLEGEAEDDEIPAADTVDEEE